MKIICLFYDKDCVECQMVKQLFELLKVPHSCLPCYDFYEAKISIGIATIEGIEDIRRFILNGGMQKYLLEEPLPLLHDSK